MKQKTKQLKSFYTLQFFLPQLTQKYNAYITKKGSIGNRNRATPEPNVKKTNNPTNGIDLHNNDKRLFWPKDKIINPNAPKNTNNIHMIS